MVKHQNQFSNKANNLFINKQKIQMIIFNFAQNKVNNKHYE